MQQAHNEMRTPDAAETAGGRIAIIRIAKLICEHGEFPCVLRDITGDCLRIRMFAPLPQGVSRLDLVFGHGGRHRVLLAWSHGNDAGLRSCENVEMHALVASCGPYEKRAIRIAVDIAAHVNSLAGVQDVIIRNLSHEGACIACDAHFAIDQRVRLAIPVLGDVVAIVRWRQDNEYGLAFIEMFRFEVMAAAVCRMQQGATRP